MPRTVTYWSAVSLELKGCPAFEVHSLSGREALGELFEYSIVLQSPDSPELSEYVTANLPYKQMVGREAGVQIELDAGGLREINGLVTRARYLRSENRRSLYEVTLQPWLALAARTSDHRIFQDLDVIGITQQVLADYPYPMELRVSHTYPRRVFQVQYGETDLGFLSRLWQEWGLYYHWQHEGGKHRLILVDDAGAHPPCQGVYATVAYYGASAKITEEYCQQFSTQEGLQSGRWVSDDFDFTRPRARLQQSSALPRNTGHPEQELYRWPGDYADPDEGRNLSLTRMQEAGAPGYRAQGSGKLRGIECGRTFTLVKHPQDKANQRWLVLGTTLQIQESAHASGQEGYSCHCSFELQPARHVFRSPQTQPKPLTTGPQTAIVTGPPGQEIHTNEYGQVKVQFHWDRYGQRDEHSSCWIRVSQPWAGSGFGGVATPRIGQEVIVDFENGDPDRPIITGRVYNALNMPPWALPGNASMSGLLSRSTPGGTPGAGLKNGVGDANALRFEDKKGQEQLWLHAQKDQLSEVEHDEDKWVGHDRRKTIDHDETSHILNDRTETVGHDERITVHNNRTERVDHDEHISIGDNRSEDVGSNETVQIGGHRTENVGSNETVQIGGNRSVTVGGVKTETVTMAKAETIGLGKALSIGGAYQTTVGGLMNTTVGLQQSEQVGMNKTSTVGMNYTITVGDTFTVKVGESVLVMKSDGTISLNGKAIDLVASSHMGLESERIDIN